MGYSFANIQIRKTDGKDTDAQRIADILTSGKKLTAVPEGESADILIDVLSDSESPWITVVSDLFDEDSEQCVLFAKLLSEKLKTPTIAIYDFDSDYLFLNLLDAEKATDAWAACGRFPFGRAPRRSNFSAWRGYVPDTEAFRKVMRGPYTFAEECLEGAAQMLSLPVSQSARCMESAPLHGIQRFRYRLAEAPETGKQPEFFLTHWPISYGFGSANILSFSNEGGASRGVGVFLGGPCLESRLVEIESVFICQEYFGAERMELPLQLKQTTFRSGQTGWYCELPDFPIPPAAPRNLPWKKAMRMEFQRQITLRFRLLRTFRAETADRLGELRVTLIPLKNFPGQDSAILSGPGEEERRNDVPENQ